MVFYIVFIGKTNVIIVRKEDYYRLRMVNNNLIYVILIYISFT